MPVQRQPRTSDHRCCCLSVVTGIMKSQQQQFRSDGRVEGLISRGSLVDCGAQDGVIYNEYWPTGQVGDERTILLSERLLLC